MVLFYTLTLLKNFLRIGFIPSAGRNFMGQICIRHRGGALKRRKYYVDFFRRINLIGYIIKIQKTPFYTGNLGLIIYQNGLSNYLLLAEDLYIGDRIYIGTALLKDKDFFYKKIGSAIPLSYISLFSKIHNLELYPFKGGQLARAAGTSVIVSSKTLDCTMLKVKSG